MKYLNEVIEATKEKLFKSENHVEALTNELEQLSARTTKLSLNLKESKQIILDQKQHIGWHFHILKKSLMIK